jgi:branched-chain amino acid transport system substrate-binding protein
MSNYANGIWKSFAIGLTVLLIASTGFGQDKEPVKIGAIFCQSPPGSVVQGTQVKVGLEIARDIINADGGVLGRPVKLLMEDGQGIPEKGRAAAEKLITKEGVVALTGEHQSSNVLAEIEVAKRHNIPFVNTNGWSDAIRKKGYLQVFNPSNYNTRVADAMASVISALGVTSVVAFAENTDYGIGQAQLLGEFIKKKASGVKYKFETLDRQAKDYMPAVLPLKSHPPDVVVNILLPPGAYILMNQLYEQKVAPSKTTWLYDGAGLADYPDFWDNVKDAGRTMLEFGLYHPSMDMPPMGQKVSKEYEKRLGREPNRLIFQAADSLFLLAEAMNQAGTTDADAVIKTMQSIKFTGARGTITFSKEPGYSFQQWLDVPFVTYQLTETGQPVSKAPLVQGPGMALDTVKLVKPGS